MFLSMFCKVNRIISELGRLNLVVGVNFYVQQLIKAACANLLQRERWSISSS